MMIQIIHSRTFEVMDKSPVQAEPKSSGDFAELLGSATKAPAQETAPSSVPQEAFGDPNVEQWLKDYSARSGGAPVTIPPSSYAAAPGAGDGYQNSYYGPGAIYNQAIRNWVGNAYASMTGADPALLTSQLPGVPSLEAQKDYDTILASKNLQRLESGQAIDTSAYWSDPGPLKVGDRIYTSQELGYAGPAQSSGPQPIYLSANNRIKGTDDFRVLGYEGTVKGLEPGRYYTLQQLENAGLTKGQESRQFNPGSWSLPGQAV